MPSEFSIHFSFTLTEHHFVEAVCQALASLQFAHPSCSTNFRTISATYAERNGDFQYKYTANVRYKISGPAIEATLIMRESEQGDMSHRCQKKSEQFIEMLNSLLDQNLDRLTAAEPSTRYGSARWAVLPNDLAANNFLTKDIPDDRFVLGKLDHQYITVPPPITDAHCAIIGPAGSGKSTGFLIPNLIERWKTSMIVTEATNNEREQADIFNKSAGFRKSMGHQIHWFNPTLMNSTRLNPLDSITNAHPDQRLVTAQKLALIIIRNSQQGNKNDHWDKSAYLLLIALFLEVAEGVSDPKYKHIGTVLELLRLGPEGLSEHISNSSSANAIRRYETFYNNSSDGHAKGVIATLAPKLDAWVTPQVIALTAKSDVTLEQLSKQRFTFYLSVPSTRDDLKPLMAMIFNYLLGVLEFRPFAHPLSFLLDEFTNFGYIPGFHNIYTTIRKTKVPFSLGFQDQAQLEDIYGRNQARIIFNNTATKIFLTPSPIDNVQARLISEALGKKTESDPITLANGQTQVREYARHLMLPDEVLSLDKKFALVFSTAIDGNLPPVKLLKFKPDEYNWAKEQCPPPTRDDHPIDHSLTMPLTVVKRATIKTKPSRHNAATDQKTNTNKATSQPKSDGEPEIPFKSRDADVKKPDEPVKEQDLSQDPFEIDEKERENDHEIQAWLFS